MKQAPKGRTLAGQSEDSQPEETEPVGVGRLAATHRGGHRITVSPPARPCMRPLLRFSPTAAATPYRPTQWPRSVGEQVAEAKVVGQVQ